MTMVAEKKVVKRGEIYMADFGKGEGSEQSGERPCIVISNYRCNYHSPTITVVLLSAQIQKVKLPTHVKLDAGKYHLDRDSFAMAEHIRTIDKSRLIHKVSEIDEDKMSEIEEAIQIQMGLIPIPEKKQENTIQKPKFIPAPMPATKPTHRPTFIQTDTGKRQSWDQKKYSNFVKPTILPMKKREAQND